MSLLLPLSVQSNKLGEVALVGAAAVVVVGVGKGTRLVELVLYFAKGRKFRGSSDFPAVYFVRVQTL